MKKKDLLDALKDLPDDASVCLSKMMLLTDKGGVDGDEPKGQEFEIEMITDAPFHGIAYNEEENEIRLVFSEKTYSDAAYLGSFGVPVKIET